MKHDRLASEKENRTSRDELVSTLNRAARDASGIGVLFSQAVAQRLGINSTDLECLDYIQRGDGITAGDLAAATGLTSGAVTGVIDRLERAGFARRERDSTDRRVVRVRLLPEALARAEVYYRSLGDAADRLAGRYSDAELALLIDYFERSRDVVQAEVAKLQAATPVRAEPSRRRGRARPGG
jgi:DNA-binding MarR family transcriptional regulator